jgi:hypothetical protein
MLRHSTTSALTGQSRPSRACDAYGLAYDYDARRAFYPYRSTAGERLLDLLDDELRAADTA